MTNKEYMKLQLIISALRGKPYFTPDDVSAVMGYKRPEANAKIRALCEIGAAALMSGTGSQERRYIITKVADVCLDSYAGVSDGDFDPDDTQFERYPKLNFTGGKVVKKANVKGMGSAFLKRFDSLLREVRCGMPTVQ